MINLKNVKKRDGSLEPFDINKILTAVEKAYKSCREKYTTEVNTQLLGYIETRLSEIYEECNIEDIQNIIEDFLMAINKRVAKAFILYRSEHSSMRDAESMSQFIDDYIGASNAATGSKFDPNANVEQKNICTLKGELSKKKFIDLTHYRMSQAIKKRYSKNVVKQFFKDIDNHLIYLHDATSLSPYCCSVSLYPFLKEGMKSLGGPSTTPTNLESFCGQFCNLVFAISSQFSGAVATPEFLMYINYFIEKEFGKDYINNLHKIVRYESKSRTIKDVIESKFQQVVHTINQPCAARDYQSVFWNIGYFDSYYFKSMFETFRFPDNTAPNWETLSWLQKDFMKWFNNERTKTVLTFPVETMALLTDGKSDYKDKEYADWTAKMYAEGHSFFTYISDSADSLSSCCFDGNTNILLSEANSTEYAKCTSFKDAYNKYHNSIIETLIHNPYTNYVEWSKCKIIKTNTNKWISFKYVSENTTLWRKFKVTPDHILPIIRNNETINLPAKNIQTGDKLLYNKNQYNLTDDDDDNIFSFEILDINIEDVNNDDCYCLEILDVLNPYFVLANGLITHNCRLRNQISDNQFSFSLGAGGVMTGSKSVMTIDMNRLIQDAMGRVEPFNILNDEEKDEKVKQIHQAIADIVGRIHKYQICRNDLIVDFYKTKMLPVYDAGYIDLKKQYLTIGINGWVEACEYLGFNITDNDDYKEFTAGCLSIIKDLNTQAKTPNIMFNTEFVPAEGLGVKNAKWDKEDGYFVSRDVYNSYFYKVEDDTLSVIDKFGMHGETMIKSLDGGSALHMNLDEHLTQEQYRHLLNVAVMKGCNYFTFNIINYECKCGHIFKHKIEKCPYCGGTIFSGITRIIGYLKRISSFAESRQIEAQKRYYHKENL